jgi:hypothetical protein
MSRVSWYGKKIWQKKPIPVSQFLSLSTTSNIYPASLLKQGQQRPSGQAAISKGSHVSLFQNWKNKQLDAT